jgi:hypothetical protein
VIPFSPNGPYPRIADVPGSQVPHPIVFSGQVNTARIRAVLYMATVVGTRYNPHVKAVYERLLARGKSKMSSFGAVMCKLVHLCFGVLKTQQPYQDDYLKNT